MISALEGTIELAGERSAMLKTASGITYRVFMSAETLKKIPKKSETIKLWTHLYQREDTQELYGFLHFAELEFFETLIQISGIGPKSGLGIMAVASLDTLKQAIASGDTSYLTKVSGIGKKTAEKIVIELRDKVGDMEGHSLQGELDALEALKSLGYSQNEAREALKTLPADLDTNSKVREALKILGGKK